MVQQNRDDLQLVGWHNVLVFSWPGALLIRNIGHDSYNDRSQDIYQFFVVIGGFKLIVSKVSSTLGSATGVTTWPGLRATRLCYKSPIRRLCLQNIPLRQNPFHQWSHAQLAGDGQGLFQQ